MQFVFVVPRPALFAESYPHGFQPFAAAGGATSGLCFESIEAAIEREGYFVERPYAERSPHLKQVIPYSIVACGERVLVTRRLPKGGESRLHGKHSIGIGGHLEPCDLEGASRNPLERGTRRELEEELEITGRYETRRVGLINDDTNPVGAVHVGIVQVVRVDGTVDIRERDQLEGRLVTPTELRALAASGADLETWSKLLVPHVDELLLQLRMARPSSAGEPTRSLPAASKPA